MWTNDKHSPTNKINLIQNYYRGFFFSIVGLILVNISVSGSLHLD